MLNELLWFPVQAVRLLGTSGVRTCFDAWAGYFAMLLALLLLILCIRAFFRLHWIRAPLYLLLGLALFWGGSAMAAFGTHFVRGLTPGETAITGAQVQVLDGPKDADLGTLVLIGGYGSESPALCEPAVFRAPTSETADDPLLARFQKRVIIRLHGGFGWRDDAANADVAAALQKWLAVNGAPWLQEGRYNVVVAHSRGCQIVAQTPWFREQSWRRVAVHPPAGVQPYFRAISYFSPEVTGIHKTGLELLDKLRAGEEEKFAPWTELYQAHGWDQTVQRFPDDTGMETLNISPFGSHVTPFCDRGSRFWQDFGDNLPALRKAAPAAKAAKH